MATKVRVCMEHSGLCVEIKAVREIATDTKRKVDRMEWWTISTFGVAFVGLVFALLKLGSSR